MSGYRLITYRSDSGPRSGIVLGAALHDAAEVLGNGSYGSVQGILDDWAAASLQLSRLTEDQLPRGRALADAELLPPVLHPGTIYCAGANYADHVANMARKFGAKPEPDPHELGLSPWHFIKSTSCVVGHRGKVTLDCNFLDWEAELAVVIGRKARNVPMERVFDHVAGYTIGNDLSARDRTIRAKVDEKSAFRFDWIGQKNFDGACPLGPWIVPSSEIGDPQALAIRTFVNDKIKQDSSTAKMLFSTAEQIAHLSSRITLHPGDVILTGTPAGVGAETDESLKRGDRVRIEIESIGELLTDIV